MVGLGNGGMSKSRICEMAAVNGDVGFEGCSAPSKYTAPAAPRPLRAVRNPPIGGSRPSGWNPIEGPNTTPQAGRGGMVYIPFAYA
jgi:hypothetical protein